MERSTFIASMFAALAARAVPLPKPSPFAFNVTQRMGPLVIDPRMFELRPRMIVLSPRDYATAVRLLESGYKPSERNDSEPSMVDPTLQEGLFD